MNRKKNQKTFEATTGLSNVPRAYVSTADIVRHLRRSIAARIPGILKSTHKIHIQEQRYTIFACGKVGFSSCSAMQSWGKLSQHCI